MAIMASRELEACKQFLMVPKGLGIDFLSEAGVVRLPEREAHLHVSPRIYPLDRFRAPK